jgi:N-acetyl-anhydromuramyl-L-alanine amidase AmpD
MNVNQQYFGCFGRLKKRPSQPTAIVIHHTCTPNPDRTRRALKAQGYSTHYEIDRDGTIYQYASENDICLHCGSPNFACIGIDITHLKDDVFTDEQVESAKSLVLYLCKKYGIPHEVHENLSGIYPHRAIGQTACPQNFPMERLK